METELSAKEIVGRLKKEKPAIYKELVRVKKKLPKKILDKLAREAQRVADGKVVRVAVMKSTFQVEARLYWECEDMAGVEIVAFRPNPRPSRKAEKKLVSLLYGLCEDFHASEEFVEEIREDVYRSRERREFSKRLAAFCKELDAVEAEFDFDYDRDIGIVSEHI